MDVIADHSSSDRRNLASRKTRAARTAAYMRERAAEKAAHDEAARVVERWNAALAAGRGTLWSPTIRAARPLLEVQETGTAPSRGIVSWSVRDPEPT